MASRALLRTHLIQAWHKTMEGSYLHQLINSERGLQVYFCIELLKVFKNSKLSRRLFIEPNLRVGEDKVALIPDILICNNRSIIGVIELKYKPKYKPEREVMYKKDLRTLEALAHRDAKVEIRNKRFLGKRPRESVYRMTRDAVLCWGGVYRGEQQNVQFESSESPRRNRLLILHALTEQGKDPRVLPARSA